MDIEATSPDSCGKVIPNRRINAIPSYAVPIEELLYGIPASSNEDATINEVENEYEWFFPPFMKSQMQNKGTKSKKTKKDKQGKDASKPNKLSKDTIGILPPKENKDSNKPKKKKSKPKGQEEEDSPDLNEMMQIAIDAK